MEMVTEPLGQELVWRREDGNHLIKRKRKMASPPCVGKGAKRRVKGEGLHCFTVSRQEDDERPNQPKQKLMFFFFGLQEKLPRLHSNKPFLSSRISQGMPFFRLNATTLNTGGGV